MSMYQCRHCGVTRYHHDSPWTTNCAQYHKHIQDYPCYQDCVKEEQSEKMFKIAVAILLLVTLFGLLYFVMRG